MAFEIRLGKFWVLALFSSVCVNCRACCPNQFQSSGYAHNTETRKVVNLLFELIFFNCAIFLSNYTRFFLHCRDRKRLVLLELCWFRKRWVGIILVPLHSTKQTSSLSPSVCVWSLRQDGSWFMGGTDQCPVTTVSPGAVLYCSTDLEVRHLQLLTRPLIPNDEYDSEPR